MDIPTKGKKVELPAVCTADLGFLFPQAGKPVPSTLLFIGPSHRGPSMLSPISLPRRDAAAARFSVEISTLPRSLIPAGRGQVPDLH